VKDVLPSPFYSGTYHPPVFAAHLPLNVLKLIQEITLTILIDRNFST